MNIIFDLDGTLVDSAPDIIEALREALAVSEVSPVPDLSTSLVGPPVKEILEKVAPGLTVAERETVIGAFRKAYDDGPMALTVAYQGVPEVLAGLQACGARLFIATNKPTKPTSRVVKALLPNCFEDIVCIDSVAGKRLSKGQMIAELMSRHGLLARDTCVIGDGESDMQGAVENGCLPIAVVHGYGTREELRRAGARFFLELPS